LLFAAAALFLRFRTWSAMSRSSDFVKAHRRVPVGPARDIEYV
jgi:hypothetical protein